MLSSSSGVKMSYNLFRGAPFDVHVLRGVFICLPFFDQIIEVVPYAAHVVVDGNFSSSFALAVFCVGQNIRVAQLFYFQLFFLRPRGNIFQSGQMAFDGARAVPQLLQVFFKVASRLAGFRFAQHLIHLRAVVPFQMVSGWRRLALVVALLNACRSVCSLNLSVLKIG